MAKSKDMNKKNHTTQDLMNKVGNTTSSQNGMQDHCGGSNCNNSTNHSSTSSTNGSNCNNSTNSHNSTNSTSSHNNHKG